MYKDPVTGDSLTRAEYITRQVQEVVRSPWFLVAFNLITLICFLHGGGWQDAWNWFASWLAIMVEWMVGKYMFGQTARDAVFIRRIVVLEERIVALEEVNQTQLKHLETLVANQTNGPEQPQGRQGSVHREAAQES